MHIFNIREMQIKTMMIYHYKPLRKTKISAM